MARAKNFKNVNTENIYSSAIAQATQEAQPAQEARKERKTYTKQEKEQFLQEMKTAGRKGIKLPRINLAFAPDLHDYIKTMATAAGMSYTDFVNIVLRQHMNDHQEQYEQAVKFRNSL